MRIAIVTMGTRGDVQPYLAVAKALRARGHEIVFATHEEYASQVRDFGFEFRPIAGGFRELLKTELGRKWISSADSPREYAKHAEQLMNPLVRPACVDADRAVQGCDGVIFYAMALGAIDAAERHGLPIVCMAPWSVSISARVPSMAPAIDWFPAPVRRFVWDQIWKMVFGNVQELYHAHRAEVGLPRYPEPTAFHRIFTRKIPVVHLWSEHALARPDDWPPHAHLAGWPFLDVEDYEPPPELARFLEGEPPVYFGFGSMTGHSAEALVRIAREGARRAGVRAIFVGGWGDVEVSNDDRFFAIEDVPHDWLFPRVRAVVHHGGSSTFGAGLRAGRPTIIVPFFGDQPVWGRVNELLGTGPKQIPRKQLTEETLARALRAVIDDPRYAAKAAEIGAKMAHDDGAARAAELAEQLLTRR